MGAAVFLFFDDDRAVHFLEFRNPFLDDLLDFLVFCATFVFRNIPDFFKQDRLNSDFPDQKIKIWFSQKDRKKEIASPDVRLVLNREAVLHKSGGE